MEGTVWKHRTRSSRLSFLKGFGLILKLLYMCAVWKRGKKNDFIVEKPDKGSLSQVTKVNINSD